MCFFPWPGFWILTTHIHTSFQPKLVFLEFHLPNQLWAPRHQDWRSSLTSQDRLGDSSTQSEQGSGEQTEKYIKVSIKVDLLYTKSPPHEQHKGTATKKVLLFFKSVLFCPAFQHFLWWKFIFHLSAAALCLLTEFRLTDVLAAAAVWGIPFLFQQWWWPPGQLGVPLTVYPWYLLCSHVFSRDFP